MTCKLKMADMTRFASVGFFLFVLLVTWMDLYRPLEAEKEPKNMPAPKMASFAGPTLKFVFWLVS